MELLKSRIYLREYFYSTLNGDDIEFRALSYRELDNIQNKYTNKQNQAHITVIKTSLLNKEDFSLLTHKDLNILHNQIIEVSSITSEDMESIMTSVNILLADNFKDDTFKSCSLCQERGLDKQRNCPLLDIKTHDPMVFYIVDNSKIKVCPMDEVNNSQTSDAFRAHNMYDAGLLPMVGGLYDQTIFFVEISSLVKGLINKHQSKEMEKR